MAGLLAGAWAAVAGWVYGSTHWCPSHSLCAATVVLPSSVPYFGGLLVFCAIVSVAGFRFAFVLGGVLSAIIAAVMGLIAVESGIGADIPLALLSAAAAILSFLASRRTGEMPEQSNPMNLPVFG